MPTEKFQGFHGSTIVVKSKGTKKTLASKVQSLEKKVRGQKPELKYIESFVLNANTSWTGAITDLGPSTQGDAIQMHEGDKITSKFLTIRGHMNLGATTAFLRVVIVRSINLGVTTVSDVLATGYLGTGNAVDAPYNYANRTNFNVLYDKKFAFSANGVNGTMMQARIPLRDKIIQFNPGASSNLNNQIYMIVVSANAAGATPNWSFVSRLHYTDA